jgi:O-antigen/teichoic acid export membrane protein
VLRRNDNDVVGQSATFVKRALLFVNDLLSSSIERKWILTLADQSLVSGTSFLGGIIIARSCEREQLGLYTLGLSVLSIITLFQYAFISSPYNVYSNRLTGSAQISFTGSTFLHQWALSALSMAVLAGVGICLSQGVGPHGLESVIWMLVFAGPFILLREYARRVCLASLRMHSALRLDSIAAVIQVSGLLLLAYSGNLSASRAFGVAGLGCGFAGLSWIFRSRASLSFSVSRALADFSQNWSFGKWVIGSNLATVLNYQLYPWVLAYFHNIAAVGVLSACQGAIAPMTPFIEGSASYFESRTAQVFARGDVKGLRALVIKGILVVTVIMALFCTVVSIFGGKLVVFLYGSQYAGQSLLVSLLSIHILFATIGYAVYFGLRTMEKHFIIIKGVLIRMVFSVTLGVWLVKISGSLGVGYGFLIGSVMVCLMYCVDFSKMTSSGGRP